MKIIFKKIAILFTGFSVLFIVGVIAICAIVYAVLGKETLEENLKFTLPVFEFEKINISVWVATVFTILLCIFLFFIIVLVYRVGIKVYEKRNYKYFIVAPYPSDYQQDENSFYDKHVSLLQRMHSAITRPYYAKFIFGKMKFGLYIVCDNDDVISLYYAVHKNRAAVFETFFKQQFPGSDLFEKELSFKNYKHYRKIFSHNPKTFFDDKKEMTRELFTNIQKNCCLMIEVHAEHKNVLRQQIKKFSKLLARENGIKDKGEIDGILQNEKKELKNRITDKEVVFNVNMIAATDEKWKFAFAHDVQTATKGHNELKVYRWPVYLRMIQRIPNLYYSKTYMTDKEIAVIFRFPCEEGDE